MCMPWISYWNDGWFIWDWFCTVYSAWINGSIGITIQQSVGTTMLVILPIAIGGG